MTGHDGAMLMRNLPYARRYARALTGSQQQGDVLVTEALRHLLEGSLPEGERALRVALYAAVSDAVPHAANASGLAATQRMLLLLTALEELPLGDAAAALRLQPEAAAAALHLARDRLRAGLSARVLIIEDEPIIALDIQDLLEGCGHSVVGIAASEQEAVEMARRNPPTLVLADLNLGAGGDGAAAVARILNHVSVPVIFVTAHPEWLLTGGVGEPAFIIGKPFDPMTLAVTTYQAVMPSLLPL